MKPNKLRAGKIAAIFFLLMIYGVSMHAQNSGKLVFTARLTGAQEVPAVSTAAHGVAVLAIDPARNSAIISVSYNGLSGAATGAHIHKGAVGVNGGPVIHLTDKIQGNRILTRLNLTDADIEALLDGTYYINVHTAANSGGEIRGQLMLESDRAFKGWMDGSQENPAVTTNGYGLAVAILSLDSQLLEIHAAFRDLSTPVTSSHLHYGVAGKNGPVTIGLTPNPITNTIDTTIDLTSHTDRKGFIDSLMKGKVYINVHTVTNSGGEIRAQMMLIDGLAAGAILNGFQESPPVVTAATGVAAFWFSSGLDTIHFDAMASGLSGNITGAHIHLGAPGVNGPVILQMTSNVSGFKTRGMAAASIPLVTAIMNGAAYMNIHTSNNTGGEIRGQVLTAVRESFIAEMNGGQEVPAVTTSGTGAGVVSISHFFDNARFMVVWSGLSGAATAAHFHQAAPGKPGSVVFNLGPFMNNDAVFGFWNTASFTPAIATAFRANNIYVNVHTAANTGGEIRGNLSNIEHLLTATKAVDPGFSGKLIFSAMMTPEEEVDTVNSNGSGVAGIMLTEDRDSLIIRASATGLSSNISGAHIHSAMRGVGGPVSLDLSSYRSGPNIYGVITGASITQSLIKDLISGNTYINYHTTDNPSGEVRGQLGLEADYSFKASMSGANEVPVVATSAYGLTTAVLNRNMTRFQLNMIFEDLSSSVSAAHLHYGAMGKNGPAQITLTSFIVGNRLNTVIDVSGMPDFIDSLMMGHVYINVHTTSNTAGEIRGQLLMPDGLGFQVVASSDQEVNPTTSTGTGLGFFELNPTMDTLSYEVVADGLTGAMTGAHFHVGKPGENGGVILGLTGSISGNRIAGASTALSDSFINYLLASDLYFNMHTAAFSGGEIRGQVLDFAREGDVFALCGDAEKPSVNTNAFGTGVVSISPMFDNVHFMVSANQLSGSITGAHFHKASVDTSGPVVFAITSLFDGNTAEGFWGDTGTAPFGRALAQDILDGNMYMNIHTSANGGGEIRGNILSPNVCLLPAGMGNDLVPSAALHLYPAPFRDELNIILETAKPGTWSMEMYDMQGRIVIHNDFHAIAGKNTLRFEMNYLNSGCYLIRFSGPDSAYVSKKVIKQ